MSSVHASTGWNTDTKDIKGSSCTNTIMSAHGKIKIAGQIIFILFIYCRNSSKTPGLYAGYMLLGCKKTHKSGTQLNTSN